MPDFKKLKVWRKAHALSLEVERIANRIRGRAALRNQMTRAADSAPTNIVEGRGQSTPKEFARYLRYSVNSITELEHLVLLARDKNAISGRDFRALTDALIEVRKMLWGLIRKLKESDH